MTLIPFVERMAPRLSMPVMLAQSPVLVRLTTDAALNAWDEAVAVAFALSTNWVALVTDAMVAPAGILGPLTRMPATRPVVLATVTVVEALVVEPPVNATVGAKVTPPVSSSAAVMPPIFKIPAVS